MYILKLTAILVLGMLLGYILFHNTSETSHFHSLKLLNSELIQQNNILKQQQIQIDKTHRLDIEKLSAQIESLKNQLRQKAKLTVQETSQHEIIEHEFQQSTPADVEFKDINSLTQANIKQFWDKFINQEQKDEQWATDQENKIKDFFQISNKEGNLEFSNIECKSLSCKLEITSYNNDTAWMSLFEDMRLSPWWEFEHTSIRIHSYGSGQKGIEVIMTSRQAIQNAQNKH